MIALLLALATTASAQTIAVDTVGGTSNQNTGNWAYKLNSYDVSSEGTLDLIEVWLDGENPFGPTGVTWVVYEEVSPNQWDLIFSQADTITNSADWQASGAVGVPLLVGRSYAIGVYLGFDNTRYFWDSPSSNEPVTWGIRTGAVYSSNGGTFSVPDPINDSVSDLGYRQRLTVTLAEDLDGDGSPAGLDCDDNDPTIYPGAPEPCDGIDHDCTGVAGDNAVYEDWWPDGDGDGFGDGATTATSTCDGPPAGHVDNSRDCDDGAADVYPDAPELCDGVDQNCNGVADDGVVYEDWWPDGDGDGFGDAGIAPTSTCDGAPAGYVDNDVDCDDGVGTTHPGAPEFCNGVDDDCDLEVDEEVVYTETWPDADGDGFGDASAPSELDCAPRDGRVLNNDDCNDQIAVVNPDATELCDALDNNCDGALLPDELDSDLDGYLDCEDCDPADPLTYPGAEELCDGVDRDCNGMIPGEAACREGLDEGLRVAPACGCSATPGAPLGTGMVLLVLGLITRSRRCAPRA